MRIITEGVILVAKLIVYKNQTELMTLDLDPAQEYIAGRASECNILLDDVVFSRQHFKIFYQNGKWAVQSISKYSQLAINHRESDYFIVSDGDKFSTFSYEFLFRDEVSVSKVSAPAEIFENSSKTPIKEIDHIDDHTDDISDLDDKTFVPQMSSQEWSVGVPYLLLRKEDGSTQTLRLEGDYWILGRDEGCDITVDDPKASREHCEIYCKQRQFFLIDKNSSNGTILNYKRVTPGREIPIKSGDQIQIGKILFIFEIRDPLFTEKLAHLPVETNYTQPQAMQYSSEMDSENIGQKVIRVSPFERNKKKYMIGGTVFLLLVMFMMSGEDSSENKNLSSQESIESRPIDSLSPDQKDLVEKSYTLAKTLYTQGKYELALTEIGKIHGLISTYKDSKEIEQYSKNAIDTLMQQKEIERNEQEQAKLAAKVESIVEQCSISYRGHRDSEKLDECLSPALDLDPENAKAAQLVEMAEQEDLRQDQVKDQRMRYQRQVAQRKRLFLQAENLKKRGKTLDALTTYSRHIASTLPDPERLEDRSRQEIRSLQQKINEEVNRLKSQARNEHSQKNYKIAIAKLEEAIRLNPQDAEAKDQHSKYSKELQGIVKNLYGDSVLEENLGDIDSAKEKWKKIRSMDVPHSEYYKKSGLKLKKYGA